MASSASRQDLRHVSPFSSGSGRRLAIEPQLLAQPGAIDHPPLMQHQRLLRRTQTTAPTPPPSAPADLGQVPLNAETIQHLHSTLRSLPRPLLESLTRAFRKRFQVPEAAATIADRINPKCHDWIETLLKKRQELTREQAIKLWAQKRQQGWQPCEPQWLPPPAPAER